MKYSPKLWLKSAHEMEGNVINLLMDQH